MSTAAKKTRYTAEEYLKLERAAEFKSEFIDGQIFPMHEGPRGMAGASVRHGSISGNLFGEIYSQLKGRPCAAWMSDLRVAVAPTGLYTYPDVVVVCGAPQCLDDHFDTIINPTAIIEILSPSTEAWDRGRKYALYRLIESLQTYAVVAQDRPRVVCHDRRGNDWPETVSDDLDDVLRLSSIGCEVSLRAIYDRVEFDPPRPS